MKIKWNDPRFKGLNKKQIKEVCEAEARGKTVKMPKPQLTKRVNKKIKKQEFISSVRKKNETNVSPSVLVESLTVNGLSKERLRVIEQMKSAPVVVIDSSFEAEHNKKALTSLLCEYAQINNLQFKLKQPMNVIVTGIGKRTQRMLAKKQAMKWAMCIKELSVEKIIDKTKLIYLSPEATEVMTSYDPKLF